MLLCCLGVEEEASTSVNVKGSEGWRQAWFWMFGGGWRWEDDAEEKIETSFRIVPASCVPAINVPALP
jgi:hypothetical protein